jgi:ABC-type glycerol-3-phosphate transport system permease component
MAVRFGPARGQSRRALRIIVLIAITCVFAVPFVWLLLAVFRPAGTLLSQSINPIPSHWTLANLQTVFSGQIDIPRYAWNTAVLCVLRAVGTLMASSLAAYAFTKLEFPGRKILFGITLSLLILPPWALIVPQYNLFGRLHWLGSIKPLTVPLFFGDPFTIFLLSSFMRAIPRQLNEAAEVDGAGHIKIFWRIILPNMRAPLIVAGVLSIIDTYNDFFGQIIYLNNNSQYTLALAAFQFVETHGVPNIGAIIAFTAVALTPLVIIFFLAQRQLREINLASGLKG